MPDSLDVVTQGEPLHLEQRAELGGFWRLSLKNGLLNIVTLSLYRFWGKTEIRRRVWSSTWLNGEPFEYTGLGKELFFGFLIVTGVLAVPFLALVFAVQFLGPAAAPLLILPLYILVLGLAGLGQFTAFRYMASRTAWRGVRFQLTGSAWAFGGAFLLQLALSAITLGWWWPQAERLLAGRIWGGLKFGDQPFRFDRAAAERERVYPAFMIGAFGIAGLYVVMAVAVVVIAMRVKFDPSAVTRSSTMIYSYVFAAMFGLVALALFSPYYAARLRSVVAGIRLGEARFRLALTGRDMFALSLSNIALLIVSLGFLMPLIQARTTKFLLGRLKSEGVVDFAAIGQAQRGPRTGEGLADAFDLSPI